MSTRPLDDGVLDHLRATLEVPDLDGTRYELDLPARPIGRGGMGSVWRARDTLLGREVALKVLDEPDLRLAAEQGARMLAEARVLATLEHPGIVPVHDAGTLADGRAFACMKLVRGRRLDELVADGIAPFERLSLFARIAETVAFAHSRGVLHLDLKPANVMVGEFGEVLVLDWGLASPARAAGSEHVASSPGASDSRQSPRAGTPGFMAPEQEHGGPLDARSDVFALGRLLAALDVRGRELDAIVARATRPNPDERYAGALELADEVRRYVGGEPVHALPETPLTRLLRFARKYRAALWLIGAYAAMRVGFELFRLWRESRNS